MLKFLSEWWVWIVALAGIWFLGWGRVVYLNRNFFIVALFSLALIIMIGTLKFGNETKKFVPHIQQVEGKDDV